MNTSHLQETDAFIAGLLGSVEQREGYRVVRTPQNPGFYFGNFLILDDPPGALEPWLDRFEQEFGTDIHHRCFSWAGEPLAPELEDQARSLGLIPDGTAEMALTPETLQGAGVEEGAEAASWAIRPLDVFQDWGASEALAIECDGAIADESESYRLFSQRLREDRRQWLVRGLATWWGVFAGEQLVGQCGLVVCGEVGRYQAVETHPAWRRRGVCRALMSAVARDAFERLKLPRLILAAEVDGPAIGLYSRIGFEETGRTHSLVRHPEPMHVRDEAQGDWAGVRSLVNAAFGTEEESALIENLRGSDGVISLIAEQANTILGHILFSPLSIQGAGAKRRVAALAPLAVRPVAQGRGVGSLLVRQGIERCKAAGHEVLVVIGHPDYYSRFGFVPATEHGLRNPFGVEGPPFMILELVPGALENCGGDLIYLPAFAELS